MNRRLTILLSVLVFLPFAAAYAQEKGATSEIQRLVDKSGISGFEADVRHAIRNSIGTTQAKVTEDEAGNLIATIGTGAPHVLITAPMDEDGFFVSAITDDGYLRVHRVSTGVTNRLFEQMHYGQPVWIRTQNGKHVAGVFVTASSHLQRGRDTANAGPKTIDDLWIDVGAENRGMVERLGIRMLDPVSLRERSQVIANGRMSGVAAHTRALDWALARFVKGVDPKSIKGTVTVAWLAQTSFGDRGAARLAHEIKPDRVIALVKTSIPSDGNNPRGSFGELGRGPIGANGQAVPAGVRAPAVWQSATAVSLPALYSQSTVETIDTKDVDDLVKALASMVGGSLSAPTMAGVAEVDGRGPAGVGLRAILGPLVSASAVSGNESPVRELIARQLPKWTKPEVDEQGNLTVTFGGTAKGKELVFVSHMDEIGYDITNIADEGTATVRKRGGFFDMLWEAHPVFVQTKKGAVPAIVAPRPGYLTATTGTPRPADMVLYFGTNSRAETEALGVAKGDTATIRKELTPLAGSRWTARAMDDRCGVAAMIAALKQIDPAKVPNKVTFAFVVGEETGLVGSGFLAERSHPVAVFAIDTFVSSDSPVDPQRMALVPLGSAVVSRAIDNSSITPPEIVARIIAIGKTHKIPVVASTTSGGNDGSQFSKFGSIVAPLSWPGRYSHSPVEVMDMRDLNNLVGLINALVIEF